MISDVACFSNPETQHEIVNFVFFVVGVASFAPQMSSLPLINLLNFFIFKILRLLSFFICWERRGEQGATT